MHIKNNLTLLLLAFLVAETAYSTSMSSGSADRSIIPSQISLTRFKTGSPAVALPKIGAEKTIQVETSQPLTKKTGSVDPKSVSKSANKARGQSKLATIQTGSSTFGVQTVAARSNSKVIQRRLNKISRLRSQYVAAEKALIMGKRIEYGLLLSKLRNYPLYPYLVKKDYSKRLKSVSDKTLQRFLKKYGTTIPGQQLRFAWMRMLAKQQRWSMITKVHRPSRSHQQTCLYKTALYKLNRKRQAFKNMSRIWLTHRRLSSACQYMVGRWHASGKLTTQLVWNRAAILFSKRRLRNVSSVIQYLPASERRWLRVWSNIRRNPAKITDKSLLTSKHPVARRILAYGIKRLARSKPDEAAIFWKRNAKKYKFTAHENAQIVHQIGMTYAYRGKLTALKWLSKVPESAANDKLKAWRVRVALAHKKWPQVIYWINKLKSKDYTGPRWTYWRARALEATGKKSLARKLYKRVAIDRSFEGFLAADRLRVPYSFQSRKLSFPKRELLMTESIPGILRARELFFTGNIREARREWYYTIRKFKELDLRRAALLAHRWQWHDRAILTLGKSSYRDDLTVRFPLKHKSMVIKRANHSKIEPAWAMAVIRRESAFQVTARSGVGARGLMQLMPRTARYVARKLKIRMRTAHLRRPKLNITLGVSYLRYQLDKFSGHPILATAAYNAGPHRVTKWLKQRGLRSADIWVETIPYHETREYVRNVMAYIAIYERRMGLKERRLKFRLKPVSEGSIAKTDVNF